MDDGAQIALWDTGVARPPLVFIHGFPENHRCWDRLLSLLPSAVTEDFRIITYDLRGFGESSKQGEASISRLYADHMAIIKSLKISSYHFIGHDWGGALALQAARFNPEELRSAAVMNTNFWRVDLFGMWHLIFLNIPLAPWFVFRFFPEKLFSIAMLSSFADPGKLEKDILNSYLQMFRDASTTRYWVKLYRNMAKTIIAQKLPLGDFILPANITRFPEKSVNAYHVNIMLLWGKDDSFAPLWIGEDMFKRLEERGAKVGFHSISEAGHFVQEDQPDKIIPLLIEHWRSSEERIEKKR